MLAIELVALTAFAVAQPLYDLVASNPTFLVAHRLSGIDVLWYALALLLVPPIVLLAVEALAGLVHPAALRPTHAVLAGLLVGMTVTPPLARALSLGTVAWLLLYIAIAVPAGLLRWSQPVAASVLRFAALAAPVFLVLFLTSADVRDLLAPSDAGAVADASERGVSVVWLVLDELPLGVLLDEDGELDAERFPGFARLAEVSTWYPEAVASSPRTNVSLLSALTGQHPSNNGVLPVGSEHPVNAFSLFGAGHEMRVREAITQLCPPSLCPEPDTSVNDEVLWTDTWTIYVRSVTPDSVADGLVPETGDRWAGFGDSGVEEEADSEAAETAPVDPTAGADEVRDMDELFERVDELTGLDQRLLMDALVEEVGSGQGPAFTFVHALLPHIPYRYLPGGLAYDRGRSYGSIDGIRWIEDKVALDHMMQRMLLQTQYADEQVGRLVDRLQESGRLDDTVLVVTSDHGVSMTPGSRRREYQADTIDDMLPIPLFVHFPGQDAGAVDRRPAQPVDILPTLVEVAGVDVPPTHDFDGTSLAGPPDAAAELTSADGVVPLDPLPDVTAGRVVELKAELFPSGGDFYRPRRHGDLVGQPVPGDEVATADDLVAELSDPARYEDVDVDSGIVPAHVVGTLAGRDEPVDVAMGLDGTVAGVGRTYSTEDGWQISVMVDPAYLSEGANELTVWEIRPDGLRAVALG